MLNSKIISFSFSFILFSFSFGLFANEVVVNSALPNNIAKGWKRVYLASFPQSGNHWARYMIEEASGIATSSVYCDPEPPGHMSKIFPWGGYCCDHGYTGNCRYPMKNDLVLVKTHFPYPHKESPFDHRPHAKTLLIVRNPVDAIYSRHLKVPQGPIQSLIPPKQLKKWVANWRSFHHYWSQQKQVIIIRYEDMLENPAAELKKMCNILNYEVTDEDINRAVLKYPPEGGVFKHLQHYRTQDLHYISKQLKSLLAFYGYEIPLSPN